MTRRAAVVLALCGAWLCAGRATADEPKKVPKEVAAFGTLRATAPDVARSQAQEWLKGAGKTDAATQKAFADIWNGDRTVLEKVSDTLSLGSPEAKALLDEAESRAAKILEEKLSAQQARLEDKAIEVERGARALADERRVTDLIVLRDPAGNRLEIFHGAETATEPFKPGRSISSFRTGPLGLGHVVLNVDTPGTIDRLMAFYCDLLGFRLTDYYSEPFVARFLHINPRHHSLAFIQTGKNAVHHLMMELFSFDDVGQGYDLALADEDRVAVTLGRHTSDFITSFYSRTPSAFMVEYGWGARTIDVERWQAYERKEGPSMWGHDRRWLSVADNAKARQLRLANAANGYRRPVQVIDGNYQVMSGVCPWWDSVTSRSSAQK